MTETQTVRGTVIHEHGHPTRLRAAVRAGSVINHHPLDAYAPNYEVARQEAQAKFPGVEFIVPRPRGDAMTFDDERDLMPTTKKAAAKKSAASTAPTPIKAGKGKHRSGARTPPDSRTSALPPLEPEMMNDILLAIHDKAEEINEARAVLDGLIAESDALVREAVDDGERYRDIAASANRTVPWVQMSLRRVAGVATHPAAPIPDSRIRRARKAS